MNFRVMAEGPTPANEGLAEELPQERREYFDRLSDEGIVIISPDATAEEEWLLRFPVLPPPKPLAD
jgi:hypothetical protein